MVSERFSDKRVTWALVLACVWGAAEATVFFIVPDVLLTWIALEDHRSALKACAAATLGALIGGAIMWAWGSIDASAAIGFLDHVPAISSEMIQSVERDITSRGAVTTLLGPLTGTPYKIYAVQSGALHVSLLLFTVVTVPARLVRFLLLTMVTGVIAHLVSPRMSRAAKRGALVAVWLVFYLFYFLSMPK